MNDTEKAAYQLGKEHAENAASWTVNGHDETHCRRVLTMLQEGDPAAFDYLPREPQLSGEYADDLTPLSLAHAVSDRAMFLETEDIDAIADAYESGVSDHFEPACERELLANIDNDHRRSVA